MQYVIVLALSWLAHADGWVGPNNMRGSITDATGLLRGDYKVCKHKQGQTRP